IDPTRRRYLPRRPWTSSAARRKRAFWMTISFASSSRRKLSGVLSPEAASLRWLHHRAGVHDPPGLPPLPPRRQGLGRSVMSTIHRSSDEREARRELRSESRRSSTYKAFLKDLVAEGLADQAEAERACVLVLTLLLQRLTRNEAADLCAQLPGKLQDRLEA